MQTIRYFTVYLKSLLGFAPWRFSLGCLLIICNTLLSGVGLLLLIPLLHYTGWLPQTGNHDLFSGMIAYLPAINGHLSLLMTLLIFVALITTFAAVGYWQNQSMANLRQDYLFHLRQQLNDCIAHARWSYLLTQKMQHVEHMIATGISQISVLTYYCLQMISSSIIIVFYLLFSFIISFKLTLITCVAGGLLFLLLRKHKALLVGQKNFKIQREMQQQLAQFLDGLKLAKSYNCVDTYTVHFQQLNFASLDHQRAFSKNQSMVQFLFLSSSSIIFSVLFFVAVAILKIHVVSLIALLVIFSRLLPRVSTWQQNYLQMLNILPTFVQAQTMLTEFSAQREIYDVGKKIQFSQQIQFKNVYYRYQETPVLKAISCQIKINTTNAVVGASGAGKSTLADLLLGLLVAQAGNIYIDNVALDSRTLYAWREMVSYVPQDAYLFNDTVRANLAWAASGATDAQIWQALQLAAADKFVTKLPQQLDTLIGDRGIHLSGGERQRLALARALLRKPRLLVLDEATSALDNHNEKLIYQSLRQLHGRMTILIITHRYSTIRAANQVLVLQDGSIVESGAPQDLLSDRNSCFSQLFLQQHFIGNEAQHVFL